MNELWKPIDFTDGEYEISNCGNIRKHSAKGIVSVRTHTDRCGYARVSLLGRTYAVHRLVANAFVPNPYNYPIIHHIDENKKNNVSTNLLWCSYQQNNIFGVAGKSGKNAKRKYTVLQMDLDGNVIAVWNTFEEAKRALGLKCASLISKCANSVDHRKTAYGYKWAIRYNTQDSVSEIPSDVMGLLVKAFTLAPSKTIKALNSVILDTKTSFVEQSTSVDKVE